MGSFPIRWPFGKGSKNSSPSSSSSSSSESTSKNRKSRKKEEEDESYLQEFGVTQPLIDYVKGFTINTFKDYPLQDDEKGQKNDGSAPNVTMDLTEWQERHATLVLSKVKEVSHLRYVLIPRHLKERHFWRIYFLLVKSYVTPYELHALTKAKLRALELQNEESTKKAAIEVEMTDTKLGSGTSSTVLCDSE